MIAKEGKEWALTTIDAAWRAHKCRFKKKHYSSYEDDKTRWQKRPKTIPNDDFIKLLAKRKKKTEQKRSSDNRDHRLAQKTGPKSFAIIKEEMRKEHPNKEEPSLAALFERTRRRKEGKKYIDYFEDKAKKIEEMKNYEPPEDGSGPSDACLAVMVKSMTVAVNYLVGVFAIKSYRN